MIGYRFYSLFGQVVIAGQELVLGGDVTLNLSDASRGVKVHTAALRGAPIIERLDENAERFKL